MWPPAAFPVVNSVFFENTNSSRTPTRPSGRYGPKTFDMRVIPPIFCKMCRRLIK